MLWIGFSEKHEHLVEETSPRMRSDLQRMALTHSPAQQQSHGLSNKSPANSKNNSGQVPQPPLQSYKTSAPAWFQFAFHQFVVFWSKFKTCNSKHQYLSQKRRRNDPWFFFLQQTRCGTTSGGTAKSTRTGLFKRGGPDFLIQKKLISLTLKVC